MEIFYLHVIYKKLDDFLNISHYSIYQTNRFIFMKYTNKNIFYSECNIIWNSSKDLPKKDCSNFILQKHQENSRNIHVSGEKRRKEKSELIFELDHIYWFKTLLMSISRINWSKKAIKVFTLAIAATFISWLDHGLTLVPGCSPL